VEAAVPASSAASASACAAMTCGATATLLAPCAAAVPGAGCVGVVLALVRGLFEPLVF